MSPFIPCEYTLTEGSGVKGQSKISFIQSHYFEIYNSLKTEWEETFFSDPSIHRVQNNDTEEETLQILANKMEKEECISTVLFYNNNKEENNLNSH